MSFCATANTRWCGPAVTPGGNSGPQSRLATCQPPSASRTPATRLNVIGSLLGLPTRAVAEVVEPFLIRSGLVTTDDQGRQQLTAAGRVRVAGRNQDHAEGD